MSEPTEIPSILQCEGFKYSAFLQAPDITTVKTQSHQLIRWNFLNLVGPTGRYKHHHV
jgi:hypothetical protein